jgi:hypothetical protein
VPKKAQITQERVEYNVFLFDEPLKGSKSLKIFKISLTFRFDKLSNLSKSVHTEHIEPTTSPIFVFSVSASVRKKWGYERKLLESCFGRSSSCFFILRLLFHSQGMIW